MGMMPSCSPWKSMMLMGNSGMGLKPLRGALHTGPTEAKVEVILSRTRDQMNIPPLDIPETWILSVSIQSLAKCEHILNVVLGF